jgi:hypothetical protein
VEVVANRVAADRGYRVVTIDKRLLYLARSRAGQAGGVTGLILPVDTCGEGDRRSALTRT